MSSWIKQPPKSAMTPKKKMEIIKYNVPKSNDVAVILAFFNPAQSIRIQQNILYVYNQLINSNIKTFVGEVCFNNEHSLFQESDNVFIFKSNSYMFYKENIINLVINKIINKEINEEINKKENEQITKFVILDADIIFEDKDWIDNISSTLDNYDIIQPFSSAFRLKKNFILGEDVKSICKVNNIGHPGYVWAFRKDWYEKVGGLFEYSLIGGGDAILANMAKAASEIQKIYRPDYKVINFIMKVGYISGVIYHLPHGSINKRQWGTRMSDLENALKSQGIKKVSDATEKNKYGIIEWKDQYKVYLNNILLRYFKNREDDEFD